MKYRLNAVFCVLLASITAAQTPATKESKRSAVQGQVVQEPGGQPLRKVDVRLSAEDQQDRVAYTAVTGPDGNFEIEGLQPGRYRLSLDRNGFVEINKRYGRFSNTSLTLDSGQEIKDLLLHMQPAAVITGKILDHDGDPVPEVAIIVYRYGSGGLGRNFGGFGRTDDLGQYRISGLSPGRYLILAQDNKSLPGTEWGEIETTKGASKETTVNAPTYYPGVIDKSQAVPLELHAGDEMPISFAMVVSKVFHIRGTVPSLPASGGTPVRIMVHDNKGIGPEMRFSATKVGKDGDFDIGNVLPGSYNFTLFIEAVPNGQSFRVGQSVEVTNADVDGVRLTPLPNGHVRGQLRMDATQDMGSSQVWVQLEPDEDRDSVARYSFSRYDNTGTQVASDGSFDLKDVPAGSYHVVVYSRTSKLQDSFLKSVNLGGKDVAETGFLVGGGTYSLELAVSANGGTLEGAVVDSKDQQVKDADVVVIPDPRRSKRRDLYQQGSTDQHGHFQLRGLNPGDYTVIAFEDLGDNDYRDPEFLKSYGSSGQDVRLKEGEHKSVLLKVIPVSEEQP